ncbi:MAG: FKBP-type peptidyl-prolyl cis-trans isomerase [Solirubrobacterales bacterium]
MKLCLVTAAALLLALQIAACGGSSETTSASGSTTTVYTRTAADAVESPSEVAHAGDWTALKRYAGRYAKRLIIPQGIHPKHVVIRDLRIGKGPKIEPNDHFGASYVSFSFTDGASVGGSWGEFTPYVWNINQLVDAWWPGLKGIRAGGMRELIAPSSWAYGNGALVYLVKVSGIEAG